MEKCIPYNKPGGAGQYWAESSLKISPVEQVINAIKDSLFVADIPAGKLYGKTGTGSVNGNLLPICKIQKIVPAADRLKLL